MTNNGSVRHNENEAVTEEPFSRRGVHKQRGVPGSGETETRPSLDLKEKPMGIRSRLTLDFPSFETLLLAAWVLQCHHEQEARHRQSAPDETPAEPPETHVEPHCASELDTTSTRIPLALSKLSEAAEAGVNQIPALASPTTLNGIEQVTLSLERQAADQERAPDGSSFRLLTSKRGAWSEPAPATIDASRSRVLLPDATRQTRSARQMIGTLTAAGTEQPAAPKSKEISGLKILESFLTAHHSTVSWPVVREQWELGTASVGHSARGVSQTLQRAHSWLLSTAISAARYRQSLQTESASRYLSEAQSSLLSAARRALGQNLRQALLSLLNVAESAKNRLESFARYRAKDKVRVTPSSRRPMAAAGIMMVAFMLFQAWHHVHIVAATSRMDHPSEQNAVRKVEQFRPVPPVQASHMQVSDRVVLPVVEALSPYEIRGLRRQADYGDDSAAFVMGMVYETGRYVPQSCTKAAEWVTRSANGGNAAAQYNLGLRYRDGDGVPANEDEAEKWLRKAADQKYSNTRPALKTSPTDQKPIQ